MRPICFIAARGGSKGVPNKNLRIIKNKPLIAHSIEKAINSKIFSHVIVSTENEKIAKISKKYGAEIPFMRPKYLATDNATMDDVLYHGIKNLINQNFKFDSFVLLDCTVPFIRKKDILKTLQVLKKKKAGVIAGVYKQHLNPYYNVTEINSKGFLKIVKQPKKEPKSRQEAPTVYQLNGLFTFDLKKFLKMRGKIMNKMIPVEIPIETGLMIDTEFEFLLAKLLMEKKLK